MATFTKRVGASLGQLTDRYNTHWAGDGWKCDENYGQVGNTTEFESDGDWYGGIKNLSMRFTDVTIPQGATINSATISLTDNSTGGTATLAFKITGVDEDNTAVYDNSPIDDARTRTHTTAVVDWDLTFTRTNGTERASSDIKTIIQEIVDRGSWSSGNAIGIYLYDDGTSNNYWDIKYYSSYPNYTALLTIDYTPASSSVSASPSPSGSQSPSASKSPSASPSASQSPSASGSSSASPSPLPPAFFGLKIAKSRINVLTTFDVDKYVFHSDYGTLKYHLEGSLNKALTVAAHDSGSGTVAVTHSLGYFPFHVAYVKTSTGSTYYPQSYAELATVNVYITTYVTATQLVLEITIENNSDAEVIETAYCEYKIFKNDLGL